MASLFFGLSTSVEYSILDGRPKYVKIDGVVLLDEFVGTPPVAGWERKLAAIAQDIPNGCAILKWLKSNNLISE